MFFTGWLAVDITSPDGLGQCGECVAECWKRFILASYADSSGGIKSTLTEKTVDAELDVAHEVIIAGWQSLSRAVYRLFQSLFDCQNGSRARPSAKMTAEAAILTGPD